MNISATTALRGRRLVALAFGATLCVLASSAAWAQMMGGPGSGLEPTMAKVFFFSVLAMHVLMIFLIRERYLLEQTSSEVELLQREAEAI